MAIFEDEINTKGYVLSPNEGDSMMPLLREHRDIMVIRKIDAPLKKYDAVLFKRPNGAYVMHRIVKVCDNATYLISGDNRTFSEPVPRSWIIGVLTEVIKDGKHIGTDSREMKAYLRKLPFRRFKLKLIKFKGRVISKIKRTFGKGNK